MSTSWGSLGFALGSLGSFEVVWLVHLRSLGSLWFTLGVVEYALVVTGFHRRCWVHLVSPWVSLGSSGLTGFTRIRPGVLSVYSGSLGSLWIAMGVVGFIRGRWVH